MSVNPYESPQRPDETASYRPKTRWPGVVLGLFAGIVLLAVFLFFMFRTPPDQARRMHCAHNLKQIALALQKYVDVYHGLPPASTVDDQGRPLHSWRTLILPYLGETHLYDQIDLSKPWDDPAHAAALGKMPSVYRCPSSREARNRTTYLAVVGPHACFLPIESRKLTDITDDHASTLMVVEVDALNAVPWMAPSDADEALLLSLSESRQLPHSGMIQAASVGMEELYLSERTPDSLMRALITIAGNEGQAQD